MPCDRHEPRVGKRNDEGKRPSRFAHSEGRAGLIKAVVENSSVPVIENGTGNCHIYVDEFADLKKPPPLFITPRPKGYRFAMPPKACLFTRLSQRNFCPWQKPFSTKKNVEIRGCEKCAEILGDCVVPATEEDFAKEFLDYIISVKVVKILMRRFPTLQSIPLAIAKAL